MGSHDFLDLQFERLLARRVAADILQVLYSQSSRLVWLSFLPVQIQKLALLHVGVLLLCQHTALTGSLGVPTVPNLPQGGSAGSYQRCNAILDSKCCVHAE